MAPADARGKNKADSNLSDFEQEWDPKRAEDFLMEMSDGDEQLAVLVQIDLVHRNLLDDQDQQE